MPGSASHRPQMHVDEPCMLVIKAKCADKVGYILADHSQYNCAMASCLHMWKRARSIKWRATWQSNIIWIVNVGRRVEVVRKDNRGCRCPHERILEKERQPDAKPCPGWPSFSFSLKKTRREENVFVAVIFFLGGVVTYNFVKSSFTFGAQTNLVCMRADLTDVTFSVINKSPGGLHSSNWGKIATPIWRGHLTLFRLGTIVSNLGGVDCPSHVLRTRLWSARVGVGALTVDRGWLLGLKGRSSIGHSWSQ